MQRDGLNFSSFLNFALFDVMKIDFCLGHFMGHIEGPRGIG